MKAAVASLLLLIGCGTTSAPPPALECRGPFAPGFTRESLIRHFGAENVVDRDVHVGEGQVEKGALVRNAVEVTWSRPPVVRAAAGASVESYSGIRLGMDLAAVETLNGTPFELTGFNWDYAGSVTSWRGGKLDQATGGACRLYVRFEPVGGNKDASLMGDRLFRSDDPRMRALELRIYDVGLQYQR